MLTGPSGAIESPDQDGDGLYENLVNCLWTINLHDDYVIAFDIIEFDIQMESGTSTLHCTGDYLEVRFIL